MSGSTGESFMFLPAISGLIRPRVVILKSVLLELRDLPEEMLDAVDGRLVVSWEHTNDGVLALAEWGTLEIERSSGGTGGNTLLILTGDFDRAPTLPLAPSTNRSLERILDVCSLAKVISFEEANRAVIVLILDRKVTESLLEDDDCCFGCSLRHGERQRRSIRLLHVLIILGIYQSFGWRRHSPRCSRPAERPGTKAGTSHC
jgi:hypothetical protein